MAPGTALTPGRGYWAYATATATIDLDASVARGALWLEPVALDLDFDDELSSFE